MCIRDSLGLAFAKWRAWDLQDRCRARVSDRALCWCDRRHLNDLWIRWSQYHEESARNTSSTQIALKPCFTTVFKQLRLSAEVSSQNRIQLALVSNLRSQQILIGWQHWCQVIEQQQRAAVWLLRSFEHWTIRLLYRAFICLTTQAGQSEECWLDHQLASTHSRTRALQRALREWKARSESSGRVDASSSFATECHQRGTLTMMLCLWCIRARSIKQLFNAKQIANTHRRLVDLGGALHLWRVHVGSALQQVDVNQIANAHRRLIDLGALHRWRLQARCRTEAFNTAFPGLSDDDTDETEAFDSHDSDSDTDSETDCEDVVEPFGLLCLLPREPENLRGFLPIWDHWIAHRVNQLTDEVDGLEGSARRWSLVLCHLVLVTLLTR
eukprot:TRINITY_DN38675_c0_g1_i2.p1 TRINITY_DN38675_c0_g1~~TRINITY_DN38675_c0_g1_i2.p1  ORF type:complete len:384 (+),score=8.01 TRINITY_DN38675_c0_g1_i2:101-1252(+)